MTNTPYEINIGRFNARTSELVEGEGYSTWFSWRGYSRLMIGVGRSHALRFFSRHYAATELYSVRAYGFGPWCVMLFGGEALKQAR